MQLVVDGESWRTNQFMVGMEYRIMFGPSQVAGG